MLIIVFNMYATKSMVALLYIIVKIISVNHGDDSVVITR